MTWILAIHQYCNMQRTPEKRSARRAMIMIYRHNIALCLSIQITRLYYCHNIVYDIGSSSRYYTPEDKKKKKTYNITPIRAVYREMIVIFTLCEITRRNVKFSFCLYLRFFRCLLYTLRPNWLNEYIDRQQSRQLAV